MMAAFTIGAMAVTTTAAAAVPGTRASGIGLAVAAMVTIQLGAALSDPLFDEISPAGVVALRLALAALMLWPFARPRIRGRSREDLVAAGALGVCSGLLTLAFFEAISRIPLGVAVTIEFLGPLGVALAGSRRARDVGWVLLAGAGVAMLTLGDGAGEPLELAGVLLSGVSAVCWAGYILLNRTLGRRLPGVEGAAAAGALSALVYVPVGIIVLLAHPPTTAALVYALAAGVLSSVVPFLADLLALRRVPAHSFGIFMSLSPVFAATIGAAVLGEMLAAADWLAIGLIVSANAVAVFVTSTTASRDAVVVPA
jgi:inner membrane transporter RhtA